MNLLQSTGFTCVPLTNAIHIFNLLYSASCPARLLLNKVTPLSVPVVQLARTYAKGGLDPTKPVAIRSPDALGVSAAHFNVFVCHGNVLEFISQSLRSRELSMHYMSCQPTMHCTTLDSAGVDSQVPGS